MRTYRLHAVDAACWVIHCERRPIGEIRTGGRGGAVLHLAIGDATLVGRFGSREEAFQTAVAVRERLESEPGGAAEAIRALVRPEIALHQG